MQWRINQIQYPVHTLGNGKRICICVQGCPMGCSPCRNTRLSHQGKGELLDIKLLFNWIRLKSEAFDGITITGGEPFEQYEPLVAFIKLVKQYTRLQVTCYSSFYLHELYKRFPAKEFTLYTDILIDGRFKDKHSITGSSPGSSNQSVYFFKDGMPFITNSYPFTKIKCDAIINEGTTIWSGNLLRKEMHLKDTVLPDYVLSY
ncbi:MAG: anaerobic ribonucleotide reductase-activating protein [Bacteroidetes bacterium ADurb.Bin408]|nr:MAG: anaerobic ribonucleotide reductase-activating protein [Bacteroidetes bacterium ADurb.Bin408]